MSKYAIDEYVMTEYNLLGVDTNNERKAIYNERGEQLYKCVEAPPIMVVFRPSFHSDS